MWLVAFPIHLITECFVVLLEDGFLGHWQGNPALTGTGAAMQPWAWAKGVCKGLGQGSLAMASLPGGSVQRWTTWQ